MRTLGRLLSVLLLALFGCGGALGEVVVVVNAKTGIEQLSPDEVINIFLGRYRRLPTGVAAVPVDQPAASGLRAEFYRRLANKDLSEINAYWARLYFSGKTSPPPQAVSSADVLTRVAGNPGGIGYVERSEVDSRVRIVLPLPP